MHVAVRRPFFILKCLYLESMINVPASIVFSTVCLFVLLLMPPCKLVVSGGFLIVSRCSHFKAHAFARSVTVARSSTYIVYL